MRVFSSIVVFAAFAHLVVVLFSTAVGLMVIPSVSVCGGVRRRLFWPLSVCCFCTSVLTVRSRWLCADCLRLFPCAR